MKNACARDCPERSVGCHSSCKRYKAYREYLDEQNALKRAKECVVAYVIDKKRKGRKAKD